ncbi:MAG: HD domain-containing protein, partial [Deltaproteobacteria bacterium]|nr:HD domain-containing protein [Deltaproteobacteria bacterium]
LAMVRGASFIAGLYPGLNRDLLLAGVMIHDLGKIGEFDLDKNGDYTTDGRLLGHMILGLDLVQAKINERPDFPADLTRLLKHLIISHHGEYEFGSPKKPKIIEALALYYLDEMDAKLNGIGGFIERHATEDTGWTDYNRLMERFFYQPDLEELLESSDTSEFEPEAGSRPRRKPDRDPNQMSFLEDD